MQNTPSAKTSLPSFTPAAKLSQHDQQQVEILLTGMSLEQKVGQVMAVGFDGPELDNGLVEMIETYHVGGIIFFARNVESPVQVASLTNAAQAAARTGGNPGLLTAIDQEGGRVARLTEDKGFTQFPSAMAIGASRDDAYAAAIAAAMAAELRAVGINTNFAPDLDVNNNPQNPVIGTRSFGSQPEDVARFGAAFIQGLQSNGVIAFGKHFPGHGDTEVDSHVDLPVVNHNRTRLEAVELVPFRSAIQAGSAGIMSAHVTFPAFEPIKGLPATLSKAVLTGLLRDEMMFEGVTSSDSLEMGALADSGWPVTAAAPAALKAGIDILLFNRDYSHHKAAFHAIKQAVTSGEIPLARLDEAVRRVLTLKAHFGILTVTPVDPEAAAYLCASPDHKKIALEAAKISITLLRNDAGLLPLQTDSRAIIIETPPAHSLGQLLHLTAVKISEQPTRAEIDMSLELVRQGRPLILGIYNLAGNPTQVDLVQALLEAKARLVLVALRDPYDLLRFPQSQTMLATFSSNPPTLPALAQVLTGEINPVGRLPVELPGLFSLGAGIGYK